MGGTVPLAFSLTTAPAGAIIDRDSGEVLFVPPLVTAPASSGPAFTVRATRRIEGRRTDDRFTGRIQSNNQRLSFIVNSRTQLMPGKKTRSIEDEPSYRTTGNTQAREQEHTHKPTTVSDSRCIRTSAVGIAGHQGNTDAPRR